LIARELGQAAVGQPELAHGYACAPVRSRHRIFAFDAGNRTRLGAKGDAVYLIPPRALGEEPVRYVVVWTSALVVRAANGEVDPDALAAVVVLGAPFGGEGGHDAHPATGWASFVEFCDCWAHC
jgi:hypothetical protein